jgi:hypothetical protein
MKNTLDINFKIVMVVLILNFYLNSLLVSFQRQAIGGLSITGYYRLAALGLVTLILLGNSRNYFPVWVKEKSFALTVFALMGLMLLQIPYVDNLQLHLQGAVKFFLYTMVLIVAITSCYFRPRATSSLLSQVFVILFISVALFYPYIIIKSGLNPLERLSGHTRLSFLLGAGNEDAHFMMTTMPFLLARIYRRKLLSVVFLGFFALALFYNGTRTTLLLLAIIVVLYYFLLSRNRYLLGAMIALLLWAIAPYLILLFNALFAGEMNVILKYQQFLAGNYIGGNLSGRMTYIWLPAINHTIQHSPWIGFGNNGWLELGRSNIQLLHPYWGIRLPSPHNFFIWSFVNWGITGLSLIFVLYFKGIWSSWRAIKHSDLEQRSPLAVALFCSWISFFVWSLIANANGTHGWTIFVLLLIASQAQSRQMTIRRDTESTPATVTDGGNRW